MDYIADGDPEADLAATCARLLRRRGHDVITVEAFAGVVERLLAGGAA